MALNVTPTSGDAPYTLSIDLGNKLSIDGVHYGLEARFISAVGSCPTTGSATPSVTVRNALLTDGYYIRTITVPAGSCGVYRVDIIDLATDDILSTETVSIDNV